MAGLGGAHRVALLATFCLLMLLITPSLIRMAAGAEEDIPLGTETWKRPELHRIYVQEIPSGSEPGNLETVLIRNYPSSAEPTGNSRFGAGTNLPSGGPLFEVNSAPVTETINITTNISVEFYVSLTVGSPLIASGCAVFGTTSFEIEVRLGDSTLFSETVDVGVLRDTTVERYSTSVHEVDILIKEDNLFSLNINVDHNCPQTQGTLWWGGLESTTGIIIVGDLLQPELTIRVDDNRIPHMTFVPYSPWGMNDYDMTRFNLFIWGPIDADVADTDSPDEFIEHFSTPDGNTTVEGNRTGLTWVGEMQLKPGHHLLKSCIRTVDMSDWDTSAVSQCPDADRMSGVSVTFVQSTLRFGVEAADEDAVSPMLPLAIIWFVALFAQIGFALRGSRVLPWPVMVLMLMLTVTALPWAGELAPVGATFERENGPMPNFVLLSHGGGVISLSDLLEGKDALVLGVFQSDSPNAYQQHEQLELLKESHPEVAIAQLATGNELRALDLNAYSDRLNGSWPLLLDEAGSAVAKQLPTGSGDAVLIIDSSGTITWSKAGVAGVDEVADNLEVISLGSQQSMSSLLALLWIASWPMLFYSLPRKQQSADEDEAEELLPPGSIWLGTLLGGAFGALLLSIPLVVLALSPLSPGAWWAIEAGMALWMVWHGISLVLFRRIPEAAFLSELIHDRLPDIYTSRRDLPTSTRDVHLGIWIGWICWTLLPMFFVQGVGDILMDGFAGVVLGLFYWLTALLLLGGIVLLHRVAAAGFGRLGAIFGSMADEHLTKVLGIILASVALTMLLNAMLHIFVAGISLG